MILTGKAKEDFLEFIHINEDRFQNYNFYKLDESMQNALIIEWFDSVGIIIEIGSNRSSDSISFDLTIVTSNKIHCNCQDIFKSRQEATKKAILKANEIYNERDTI